MKSKIKCHLKLLIFHRDDARFHAEPFFVAWGWVRSRSLPEPLCSAQPQTLLAKRMRSRTGSESVMPLYSGSQRRSSYSRPIFGSNTTNSAASKTAKSQAEAGLKHTPKLVP